MQRQAPAFVLEEAEVRRRASPGCPPELIDLALECCREEPSARPKMPDVLRRLRDIERDVLTRLIDDLEHVGSIKVLQHGGKRAMPIFEPADKDAEALQRELAAAATGQTARIGGVAHEGESEPETETDGEEEKSVQQMEQDALEALAALKFDVDGKGAAALEITMNDGKQTWRTARWTERPTVLGGTAFSSAFTQIDVPAPNGAAAMDVASTMTVRASPPDTPVAFPKADLASEPATETPAAVTPEVPISVDTAKDALSKPTPAVAPVRRLQTKAERADELAAKNAPPIASGTHRFTLVDKDALQLMAGKKPTNCMSFSMTWLDEVTASHHTD